MRATVTIDEPLFSEADARAKEMGLSRSRLYQKALEHYLRELRDARLTAAIDRHLETHPHPEESRLASFVAEAWADDMGDDEW